MMMFVSSMLARSIFLLLLFASCDVSLLFVMLLMLQENAVKEPLGRASIIKRLQMSTVGRLCVCQQDREDSGRQRENANGISGRFECAKR